MATPQNAEQTVGETPENMNLISITFKKAQEVINSSHFTYAEVSLMGN